jgi:osmotically-inducible protein OsmY
MTQPNVDSACAGASPKGHDVEAGLLVNRHGADNHRVADAVANALHWDFAVPRHRVVAHCDGGWVTLTGEVERAYQRSAAEADVLRVEGVRGVTNAITLCAAGADH